MFRINGITWYVKFVPSHDETLMRSDGTIAIGMCDNNMHTIYINETLSGRLLKKVLCHEMVHAAMYSYDVPITDYVEEIVADLIATYGNEIMSLTHMTYDKMLGWYK